MFRADGAGVYVVRVCVVGEQEALPAPADRLRHAVAGEVDDHQVGDADEGRRGPPFTLGTAASPVRRRPGRKA
jgi:hypothetical protein